MTTLKIKLKGDVMDFRSFLRTVLRNVPFFCWTNNMKELFVSQGTKYIGSVHIDDRITPTIGSLEGIKLFNFLKKDNDFLYYLSLLTK